MSENGFEQLPTPSILVVDDDPASLLILASVLDGLGDIHCAASGQEALNIVQTVHPCVAVLDIEMAEMDGITLCEKLKSEPETADISVIFVTSHTQVEVEHQALAKGGIDFLSKPIDGSICRQRVNNHIQLQQTQTALKIAQQQAHKEKEWFKVTLNSIGDAVVAIDCDGRITHLNPIAEHMTGWSNKEAKLRPIENIMEIRDAETKHQIINPVRLALEQNRNVALALNCQLVSRAGTTYRIED